MTVGNLSRGELTRTEIVRAAHSLFIEQGYHGTSMRQIAGVADIAPGSLYNHFDSKEDVFRAVFLEYHPSREVLPALVSAEGETIEQFLRDALDRMTATLEKRPDFMNLLFIEIVEFQSAHMPDIISTFLPQGVQILQRITEADYEHLRPIPPLMIIRTFLGFFFAFYLTDIMLSSPDVPSEFHESAVDYFIDVYLHGILANQGTA